MKGWVRKPNDEKKPAHPDAIRGVLRFITALIPPAYPETASIDDLSEALRITEDDESTPPGETDHCSSRYDALKWDHQ